MPRSILVLPPLNESTDVDAPYVLLSTLTRPIAECGYYVFPVAVVDAFMKDNGLPTPGEMHGVPLDKLRQVFGADAVLYLTIVDWGQRYQILQSTTVVRARAELIDTHSGETIWQGTLQALEGSGGAEGGLLGMVIGAAIEQITDSLSNRTHDLARQASRAMVYNPQDGFLYGHYSLEFETDQRGR